MASIRGMMLRPDSCYQSAFIVTRTLVVMSVIALLIMLSLSMSHQVNAQQNQSTAEGEEHEIGHQSQSDVSLDDVRSGALLFQQVGSHLFIPAPQLKTSVDMRIKGLVANVTVKQTFTNTSDQWQHAVYAFPLPDNSAVNQLKITVADRVIIGEVQEKKKALKTFNTAKKKGQKAALVQQVRPNLFTTDIANIPPHESIDVELTYFQQVDYQAGEFSLHFPMAITPRYQPSHESKNSAYEQSYSLPDLIYQARQSSDSLDASDSLNVSKENNAQAHLIDLTVSLFSGAELAQLNSVNHSVVATYHPDVKGNGNNQVSGDYSLKLSNQPMEKDFKLTWQYQQKALPQVLNFQQTYQDKKYGLLMVLPGLNNTDKPRDRELTFILDTSGSMEGQSLTQAKEAFKYALTSLTKNDTFQLISFNSYPTKLFQVPVAATNANKQNALNYVNRLKSTGGTEIMSALSMALGETSNQNEKLQQIVFLTDGAVGNEAEIFSYIAENISQKRLFTVGLGTAPNRYFMKKAAEIGRGSYQFISDHSELVKEMQLLFSKLSNPVLTDLKLSLNSAEKTNSTNNDNNTNSTLVTTPDPIPDVYQNEPLFLSYQISGKETGSLLTGIYKGAVWSLAVDGYDEQQTKKDSELIGVTDTVNTDAEGSIPPLATLWARRKIADHYRALMLNKTPESKQKIIDLALNFQLVTPFTSLVAVEEKISRPENASASTKQLKNNLPAGQKLPSTALNWQLNFYIGLVLLMLSMTLMLVAKRKEQANVYSTFTNTRD